MQSGHLSTSNRVQVNESPLAKDRRLNHWAVSLLCVGCGSLFPRLLLVGLS